MIWILNKYYINLIIFYDYIGGFFYSLVLKFKELINLFVEGLINFGWIMILILWLYVLKR